MQSDKLRYCGCCHRGNMPLPLIAAVWANTMFPTPDPHGLAVVAAPLYPSSHCIVFCCRLSVCHPVSINIFLSRILSDTWGHYPTLRPIFARCLISQLDFIHILHRLPLLYLLFGRESLTKIRTKTVQIIQNLEIIFVEICPSILRRTVLFSTYI